MLRIKEKLTGSPLIQAILEDRKTEITLETIAAKFHNTLVEAIAIVAKQFGIEQILLTGGCFQNQYLTERAMYKLQQAGFQPYCHHQIPPNDGGIAAGQIMAALYFHFAQAVGTVGTLQASHWCQLNVKPSQRLLFDY